MFSIQHLIWMAIAVTLITVSLIILIKRRPPLRTVLTIGCVVCILSEFTKVFGTMQMIPSTDGTLMFPYLRTDNMPLHLCSLQLLTIFFTRFAKPGKIRDAILAFMYPTCMVGAFCAILLPNIFPSFVTVDQAFTHPLAYQFFLFHVMLVVVGAYIPLSGELELKPRHYGSSVLILAGGAFFSIYLNSIFSAVRYENNVLVSIDHTPNYFFTYAPPIPVTLTEMWHWYLYLAILVLVAAALMTVFYLPFILKARKKKKANTDQNP